LNYYGIDSNIVKYTVEDNPFKVGKFIPNTNIEIIDTEAAISFNPDLIVVLAWNFFESIKDQNKETFKNSTFVTLNSLI
jgi:hypothetical protein